MNQITLIGILLMIIFWIAYSNQTNISILIDQHTQITLFIEIYEKMAIHSDKTIKQLHDEIMKHAFS